MKTLSETLEGIEERLTHIEKYLGLKERAARRIYDRELLPLATKPKPKKHAVRRHANKAEGLQSRQQILALLKGKKRPVHRSTIGRKVRVTSAGALGWYLKDLRQHGQIKMTKRGWYQYAGT